MQTKTILDPCCGSKMFYFDKTNRNVLYCDNRVVSTKLCDGMVLKVNPDMIVDFVKMPFETESFWHVVFDPPHIQKIGDTSWLALKYGKLPKEWKDFIRQGLNECWRVLKVNGTLIFKWSEQDILVSEVIKAIGKIPLYGQKSGKTAHWLCFVKSP